jgi:hypothetical protein
VEPRSFDSLRCRCLGGAGGKDNTGTGALNDLFIFDTVEKKWSKARPSGEADSFHSLVFAVLTVPLAGTIPRPRVCHSAVMVGKLM